MNKTVWKAVCGGFLVLLLSTPAWAADPGLPGTINYVEGQAAIGAASLTPSSVGTAQLEADQTVSTQKGRVEVLLTPGVFFRLGQDSSATMVSPSLTDTEVRLNKGRAMVEATQIYKENDIRVDQGNATAQLVKRGLYDFNADQNVIRVFDGKALVGNGFRRIDVKGGHEVDLDEGSAMKSRKFDKGAYEDGALYRWSKLRSKYLSEANVETGRMYGWNGWFGGGWYWNPWFSCYTFFPASGILYSPFGWGFYPPWYAYGSPFFYGRPYFYGAPYHHDFDHGFHRGFGHRFENNFDRNNFHRWRPGPRQGAATFPRDRSGRTFRPAPQIRVPSEHWGFGGGFHGGSRGGFGEGFHGGGGFHGGFQGGFHGGGGFRGGGGRR